MITRPFSRRGFMAGTLGVTGAVILYGRAGAQEAPVTGGILRVAADSEPSNLNPAIVASNGVFFVASKVIEPLAEMSYDPPGLTPVLATEWSGSEDGLSVTFKLREGVTWHDGTPFTAADVAFSAVEVWSKLQNLGRVTFRDLNAAETPDDHTVILKFANPIPLQLVLNALPALTAVLPKHLYEGTDIATNPHNEQLVGTGPFRFKEHQPGQYYLLERNPDYWGAPLPYLDQIVYTVLPDRGAIAAAHEAGELDLSAFSAVPLADLERLGAVPGIEVVTGGYEGITYYAMIEINHRRAELADVRVRRAIRHAVDPQFIVDTIFHGYATAATGPVPHTAGDFYTADVPAYDYDPAKAEALLDEAGYPKDADGWRFALRIRPAPFFEQTVQTGDYLRQQLRAIGIDAEIVSADTPGHIKAVYTDHDFDLSIGPPVYRNDPAISTTILYISGVPASVPFSNQYGYADPEMDEIINKAAVELDPEARIALYRDFQVKAQTDLPIIPLVEFTFITVASSRVQNVATNPRWATSNWADTWLAAE